MGEDDDDYPGKRVARLLLEWVSWSRDIVVATREYLAGPMAFVDEHVVACEKRLRWFQVEIGLSSGSSPTQSGRQ